mgnify:CR=1 FL=1
MLGAPGTRRVGISMRMVHLAALILASCGSPSADTAADCGESEVENDPSDDREPALRTRLRFTTDWSVFQGSPDGAPWAQIYDESAWRPTTHASWPHPDRPACRLELRTL